jgi:hypothetical protein
MRLYDEAAAPAREYLRRRAAADPGAVRVGLELHRRAAALYRACQSALEGEVGFPDRLILSERLKGKTAPLGDADDATVRDLGALMLFTALVLLGKAADPGPALEAFATLARDPN